MKYKLTQEDYLALFITTSPEKIKKIFGVRSLSARTIRRMVGKWGVANRKQEIKEYLENVAPETPNLSREEKKQLMKDALDKKEQEVLARIWKKIEKFESRWM